jgi:hypothetical protein
MLAAPSGNLVKGWAGEGTRRQSHTMCRMPSARTERQSADEAEVRRPLFRPEASASLHVAIVPPD